MEHRRHDNGHIAAEAADWFVLFRETDPLPTDHAAFAEWLTRSPAHVQEFLEVSALWSAMGAAGSREYNAEDLIAAARAEQAQRKVVQMPPLSATVDLNFRRVPRLRARRLAVGIAASLLVGLAVWGGFVLSRKDTEFTTAVGEQRSVTLADGSVLFLNTHSEVRVRFGKDSRTIDLIRGEARFQVARNPRRPFIVATSDATIRALGTVFNVAVAQEGTQVAVIEGRVELHEREANLPQTAPEPQNAAAANAGSALPKKPRVLIELAAGQRAVVTVHGIEPDVGPTLEYVKAWTEHRLVFRDKTLAEVVGEFNRYRPQQLIIDDPELAGLRISGSFDPSDPDSLVTYLAALEAVQVSTPADGYIHLGRGSPSHSQQ